jgi:prolyl-tRNA synthetase
MGCYGIGVSRVVAAAIEQNHDANGIIWPMALAPYQIAVVPLEITNPTVMAAAEAVYAQAQAAGFSVLFDDRDERPGVKFKDMDLIGIPVRITIGKKFITEQQLEIKERKSGVVTFVGMDGLDTYITALRG